MQKRLLFTLTFLFLFIPLASAANDFAYNRLYDGTQPIDGFNYSINVNHSSSSDYATTAGNSLLFNDYSLFNYINSYVRGQGLVCFLSGGVDCTMSGDILGGGNDLTNFLTLTLTGGQPMTWNTDYYTLNVPTGLGNTIQVGQEVTRVRKNLAGRDIYAGEIVYDSGSQGEMTTVNLADASNSSKIYHLGMVTIPVCNNNAVCPVTYLGDVNELNTSIWAEGTALYLSGDTPGGITEILPVDGSYHLKIGTVTRSHQDTGIIDFETGLDYGDEPVFNNFRVLNNVTVDGNITTQCITLQDGQEYCTLSTTYYNATSFQALTGTSSGTINLTQHPDGQYDDISLNFTEQVSANALDVRINFTDGIDRFNQGVIRYRTSGLSGDYPLIQLWDYDDLEWETYATLEESLVFIPFTQTVFDYMGHVQNGTVQMRIYKEGTGNINNKYYIDWLAISKGFGTPTGNEVDPLAFHKDGSTPMQGNANMGDYNVTNVSNLIASGSVGAGVGVEQYLTDTAKVVAMGDSADFHIRQADGDLSAVFGSDNAGYGYFFVGEPGLSITNALIRFWSAPGTDNWMNNGGDFGIGTDTPREKLDVNGNIISDKLYTNNVNATSLGTIGPITNPIWEQAAFYLEDSFANKLGMDGNQFITEVPNDFFFQNAQSGFIWETHGDITDRMTLSNTELALEADLDINSGSIQMDNDEVIRIGTLDSLTGNGGRIQIQVDESSIDGLQFKNENANGQVRFLVKDDLNNYMVMNSVNSVGPGGTWLGNDRNDNFWLWAYSPFTAGKGLGIGTISDGDVILGAFNKEYMRLDANGDDVDMNKPFDFANQRNQNLDVDDPFRIYQNSITDGGNIEFRNEATPTDNQQLGELFAIMEDRPSGDNIATQVGFSVKSVTDETGRTFFSTAQGEFGGDLEAMASFILDGQSDGTTDIMIGNNGTNLINGSTTFTEPIFGDGSQLTGIQGDNSSWNESLADTLYAKYQFEDNNFNGSGDFNTTGNIKVNNITIGDPVKLWAVDDELQIGNSTKIHNNLNVTGLIYGNASQLSDLPEVNTTPTSGDFGFWNKIGIQISPIVDGTNLIMSGGYYQLDTRSGDKLQRATIEGSTIRLQNEDFTDFPFDFWSNIVDIKLEDSGEFSFKVIENDPLGNIFYSFDRNIELQGALAVGSNTLNGLSDGDINVSTVYYDTLTAKSPVFQCSDDWCSVAFPKHQKTLYIQKDENYTVLDIVYNDIHYTKSDFNTQICQTNENTQEICTKLNTKVKRLAEKATCNHAGYEYVEGSCFDTIKQITTYANSITTREVELYDEVNKTCQKLGIDLQVESYTCTEQVKNGQTETQTIFKDDCDWNVNDGYYCMVRQEVIL